MDALESELRNSSHIAIRRACAGRHASSVLATGASPSWRKALLKQIGLDAESVGARPLWIDVSTGQSFPAALVSQLFSVVSALPTIGPAGEIVQPARQALVGFAQALKHRYPDICIPSDADLEPGLADNGDLDHDLSALLEVSGRAAKIAGTALVLLISEATALQDCELAALLGAIHRCTQQALPVVLICSGDSSLPSQVGNSRPYVERIFRIWNVDAENSKGLKKADTF